MRQLHQACDIVVCWSSYPVGVRIACYAHHCIHLLFQRKDSEINPDAHIDARLAQTSREIIVGQIINSGFRVIVRNIPPDYWQAR